MPGKRIKSLKEVFLLTCSKKRNCETLALLSLKSHGSCGMTLETARPEIVWHQKRVTEDPMISPIKAYAKTSKFLMTFELQRVEKQLMKRRSQRTCFQSNSSITDQCIKPKHSTLEF